MTKFLLKILISIFVILSVATIYGLACTGGFGALDGRIVTNPTFTWTMHPPVSWTYPDANAIQEQSYLPGQSLTQAQAQNAANGDITAAGLEAVSAIGLPSTGIAVRPNYSPPLVNDCVKSALINSAAAAAQAQSGVAQSIITQTGAGQQFGIVEQGAVIYLASSTIAITNIACSTRSFGTTNPLTLVQFIQRALPLAARINKEFSASVTIEGVTASGFQLEQIAAKMMAILNFNSDVKFVTEVSVN